MARPEAGRFGALSKICAFALEAEGKKITVFPWKQGAVETICPGKLYNRYAKS